MCRPGIVGWEEAESLVAGVCDRFCFWGALVNVRACIRACVQSEGSGSFHPSRRKLCKHGGVVGSNTTVHTDVFCLDWEQWKHWHG